ncbi:MAG: diguanylate cyclase [Lachnospiraceae bacterium]|nr:diguanylate cyclase [Lachnospiraceae bacterium]
MIRQRIVIALGIFTFTLLMVGVISVFVFDMHFQGNEEERRISFSEGWTYEDGDAAILTALDFGKKGIIIKSVNGEEISGSSLCFETTNLLFNVYLDDELIYDFHPKLNGAYGKYYGHYPNDVELPNFEGMKTLRIEYEVLLKKTTWTQFENMYVMDSWTYMSDLLHDNLTEFITCFLIFIFGAIIALLGMIFGKSGGGAIETVSLGVLAMVLSVWTSTGTGVLTLLTGNSAAVRILEYLTLALMPLPALSFTAYLTKSFKNPFVWTVAVLTLINIFSTSALVFSGKGDYHDILRFSHVNILIGFIVVVYLIIHAVRNKKIEKSGMIIMLVAFLILLASGMCDFISYFIDSSVDSARFSRGGLLVFIILLGLYEIGQAMQVSAKSLDAEEKNRLAHRDGLTGMWNRLAFNEAATEFARKHNGMCAVIQFDLNNLKKVNDNYGHAAGDRQIIGAATIIEETFGQHGRCYRTGGDEFINIIEGYDAEDKAKVLAEEMIKMCKDYNVKLEPPVALEIAYGIAVYDYDKGDIEDAVRIADDRMYECKKKLKAAAQI